MDEMRQNDSIPTGTSDINRAPSSPSQDCAPVIGDAFGLILRRCWAAGASPGSSFEVTERDDGWIVAVDAVRYFAESGDWPASERCACDAARGRVLDIGCGAGRHALAMLSAGLEVTGLESSTGAAEVAEARGARTVCGSVYDAPGELAGSFDTLLMAGSLGLIASPDRAPHVLIAIAAMARPGAQLLGCSLDPYVTDRDEHLRYHEWNREQGRYPGQMRLRVRDGRVATPFFDYLFVSADELAALTAATPWRLDAYDHDGPRCLVRLTLR